MALLGRPEGSRGDYWDTWGQAWGPRTSKGDLSVVHVGPGGTIWAPGGAKGEPWDAQVGPRQAKGRPTEANMTRQGGPSGAKMGPK